MMNVTYARHQSMMCFQVTYSQHFTPT